LESSLGGKWLDLLSEIALGLKRVAIMFNPDLPAALAYMPSLETAARSLKVMPITVPVHSDAEIETAIIALGGEPGGGLVVMAHVFAVAHRMPIISAAARNKVPAVYNFSVFVRDGGLLSYGVVPVPVDTYRRAATYVDRILRGAKPGDLPVQFPTKFEMVVNRKTAKALGLAVPPRFCCAPTSRSNNCWLCRFMAPSWQTGTSAPASAFFGKCRPIMLNLSISVDHPSLP
jgi:putative ABC transport system substrate-binding protein